MSARRFFALLVAALVVISFAFWLSTQRYLPRDRAFGTPVLAGLAPAVDDVHGIRIVGPGNETLVTLDRPDGRWRVLERDYPADGRRVRALLRSLGELQVLEATTRDPERFAALGVEDVGSAAATGIRLELRTSRGPLALIAGRGSDATSAYVRVPGATQALLATPRLDLPRDPGAWLATTIVDIAPARLHSFEASSDGRRTSQGVRSSRDVASFAVREGTAGRSLSPSDSTDPADALVMLQFEALRPAAQFDPSAGRESRATFTTFDGLVFEFTGCVVGDEHWLRIVATWDPGLASRYPPGAGDDAPGPEQVRAEAERIGATTRDWWYRVGVDRYDRVFRPIDRQLRPRGPS